MSKQSGWAIDGPPSDSTRASSRSRRRPVATMRQPSAASRRAMASPKPEVAPVTIAVLGAVLAAVLGAMFDMVFSFLTTD